MGFMRGLGQSQGRLVVIELGVDPWDGFPDLLKYRLFQYQGAAQVQVPFRTKKSELVYSEPLSWVSPKNVLK